MPLCGKAWKMILAFVGVVSFAANIAIPFTMCGFNPEFNIEHGYEDFCVMYSPFITSNAITGSLLALLLIPACLLLKCSNSMIKTLMAFEILQFSFDVIVGCLIANNVHNEKYFTRVSYNKQQVMETLRSEYEL